MNSYQEIEKVNAKFSVKFDAASHKKGSCFLISMCVVSNIVGFARSPRACGDFLWVLHPPLTHQKSAC